MKTRWVVVVLLVVLGCSLSAFAGPQIGIGDPNCASWDSKDFGPLQNVGTSNSFTLTTNSTGGGFFGLCNKTGVLWSTVDIKVLTSFTPTDVKCTSTVFNSCVVTTIDGGLDLFFSETQTESQGDSGGIPKNQLMTVNLSTDCDPATTNCANAGGDWGGDVTFYGGTNQDATIPTPEPAAIVLMSTGLGAEYFRRRRRSK